MTSAEGGTDKRKAVTHHVIKTDDSEFGWSCSCAGKHREHPSAWSCPCGERGEWLQAADHGSESAAYAAAEAGAREHYARKHGSEHVR